MNVQLVMQILDLVLTLANSVVKKNGPGMTYLTVSDTLVQIVQKTSQVYQQHTGQPLDPSLITGEAPV